MLGRLLEEIEDNGALVEELYLRTLSREPTDEELDDGARVLSSQTKNRSAVFEDLFWALLNSSEFSHRQIDQPQRHRAQRSKNADNVNANMQDKTHVAHLRY